MVKGNPKSSASSATRKKHLKKHAQPEDQLPKDKKPKVKGEKGKKKSEPRVKMYIPPVKPAPVQPDPLETTGLAHSLPAELLIVLRNISKKAQVTKTRALEELQSAWVNQCLKEGRDSLLTYTLVEMLPVWFHHVSALFVNSSRRVRLLATSLHSSLLQIPPVREKMVFFLRETASSSQLDDILGTWCLAMHDIDRSVSSVASKSWKDIVVATSPSPSPSHLHLNDDISASLNSFVERAVLDPSGIYLYLNPLPPPALPPSVPNKGTGKGSSVSTPWKDDGDQTPRSKQEENEESEQDRRARLRIAGLGALRWLLVEGLTTLSEEILAFYSNPVLWSVLQCAESCPWVDIESFGFGQPNVRKSGWGLLQTLLSSQKDRLESLVPTLGTAVLRSAWVEPDSNVHGVMWQPLLVFLKQFPQSWTIEENREENESGSDAQSENEGPSAKKPGGNSPPAFLEFLQFLRSGCSGSPTQGYPAVVVIISTIPPSILNPPPEPPLSLLFASFWEASESRALSSLHRMVASSAFLSSLLECLVFLVKRMRNDPSRSSETEGASNSCKIFVHQQFSILWDQLISQKLKVEERATARLIAQALEALFHVDQDLYQEGWNVILQGMKSSSENFENAHLVSVILKVFYDRFRKETVLKMNSEDMLKEILKGCVERCEMVLSNPSEKNEGGDAKAVFELLLSILDQFRERLFFDGTLSDKFDTLLCQYPIQVLSLSHGLFLSYLSHRKDERKGLEIWRSLLSAIASKSADGRVLGETYISRLLEAAHKGQLPRYLTPQAGELDALLGSLLEKVLSEPVDSNDITLLRHVLLSSDYFISKSGFKSLLEIIIAAFSSSVNLVINGGNHNIGSNSEPTVNLVQAVFGVVKEDSGLLASLLPSLFLFAYLVPSIGANGTDLELSPSQAVARKIWEEWLRDATEVGKTEIFALTKSRLKDILKDTGVNPIPEDILNMSAEKPPGLQLDDLQDLFPSSSELDTMLTTLATDPIDPSIAVLDPLIPSSPKQSPNKADQPLRTDYRGFSAYARIISGLLQLFADERWLAKRNLWALRHFYALSIYARDLLAVPSAVSRSPVFDDKVTPGALNHIVEKSRQVSVYLLTSAQSQESDSWRRPVLDRFLTNGVSRRDTAEGSTQMQTFLFNMITKAKEHDSVRDTRILKMVLDSLLVDGIDAAEADIWIQVARNLEKAAPDTSMTIISVVTTTGAEPPKLDRYRNELAAGLLGIKPRHANVDGLLNLRKLCATAPDPNGDVIFLPPPRAVNVVKACQSWVLSEIDEDENELDEEVQSAMLPIFVHLAPILQNIPGSHWAFIFDVLEAVLEFSSDEDEADASSDEGSKLVGLSRALKLIVALEGLAKRNKSLMAEWAERRIGVFTTIRDLSVISSDPVELSSTPRSTCRELVLYIIQELPPSLLDQDTLSKMCHLIDDPSYVVQKMAYQLLKAAARKRTEYFVIEAGVDTEAVVQAVLPAELLDIILRQMDFGERGNGDEEEAGELTQNIFGYLLGWMLVFDLFQDSSFKVKSSYIEQLKNLNAVVDHFIPCFLGLLGLNRGGLSKAFKLDIWAIDQFFVELYKPGSPHTIPVLAAHVYYRALLTTPSLIHSWMLDCKDRQLSNTVTTYTSTHFSPVLIRAELEHVRSHATTDGLADDSMSIKVATAVNEVVAAYLVDEHQLEIKLRIPSDWPLHKIEVRDVKRIGVDENRWRAWVLGVQQTIWAQNGRIIDGLGLFKKNVTLHFEGQVECAICYSIISVMDGSLPKKPCKTCKNRFHAGCLYKWFNTSHSSSCPLCRSDII